MSVSGSANVASPKQTVPAQGTPPTAGSGSPITGGSVSGGSSVPNLSPGFSATVPSSPQGSGPAGVPLNSAKPADGKSDVPPETPKSDVGGAKEQLAKAKNDLNTSQEKLTELEANVKKLEDAEQKKRAQDQVNTFRGELKALQDKGDNLTEADRNRIDTLKSDIEKFGGAVGDLLKSGKADKPEDKDEDANKVDENGDMDSGADGAEEGEGGGCPGCNGGGGGGGVDGGGDGGEDENVGGSEGADGAGDEGSGAAGLESRVQKLLSMPTGTEDEKKAAGAEADSVLGDIEKELSEKIQKTGESEEDQEKNQVEVEKLNGYKSAVEAFKQQLGG